MFPFQTPQAPPRTRHAEIHPGFKDVMEVGTADFPFGGIRRGRPRPPGKAVSFAVFSGVTGVVSWASTSLRAKARGSGLATSEARDPLAPINGAISNPVAHRPLKGAAQFRGTWRMNGPDKRTCWRRSRNCWTRAVSPAVAQDGGEHYVPRVRARRGLPAI